jgi:hypothetical protein
MSVEVRIGSPMTGFATFSATQPGVVSLTQYPSLAIEASAWGTSPLSAGTSLFTGVPLLSNIVVTPRPAGGAFDIASTSIPNPVGPGVIAAGLRGSFQFFESGLIRLAGVNVPLGFQVMGQVGETWSTTFNGPKISVTGAPFVTGPIRMTGITTTWIQLPHRPGAPTGAAITLRPDLNESVVPITPGGIPWDWSWGPTPPSVGTLSDVTISGSVEFEPDAAITLVSPMRVNFVGFGVGLGSFPVTARVKFQFAPEPEAIALLVAGIAALSLLSVAKRRR